jgi:hypothetical protein
VGLVAVGLAVAWVLYIQRGAHIEPQGKILKVRTQALDETSSVAVIDFRLENSSDIGIVVSEVTVTLEDASGKTADSMLVSEVDAQKLFQYYPLLGQKYNDTLKMRDRLPGHHAVDRMIAARFEMPQAQLDARKKLTVRVEDVDGPFGELTETR